MKKIPTICPFCGCGCGIWLLVENGKLVGAEGRKGSSTGGYVCQKGKFCWQFVQHPERLTRPLKKVDGRFVKISWKRAYKEIGEKLSHIKEKHGPDAIGFLASAKCTNEDNYIFQKFARIGLGTYNIDNCARLCHASTKIGLLKSLGYAAMTNSMKDIAEAELVIVWGCNPFEDHPYVFLQIKKAKNAGARVVVIDPRKTKSAKMFEHFQLEPAKDLYLMAQMIDCIIEKKLEKKSFINNKTIGFNLLKESVKGLAKNRSHGIEDKRVEELAKDMARKKTILCYGMGITQHTHGVLNVLGLSDLVLLTGNIGERGRGLCPLRGQNNVQGVGDVGGITESLPGYAKLSDPDCRKRFELAWHTKLPQKEGLSNIKMLEAAGTREVKALYIVGENPYITHPDMGTTRKELEGAELLIVQDIFMTETAHHAHYVLPAACFAEKEGTFTNTERRVQRVNKAVEPPGEAKPDWLIICELAKEMSMGHEFEFSSSREIFDQLREVIPIYSGVRYQKLGKKGLQWPCNKEHPKGTDVLYKDLVFPTSDRKARLYPLEESSPEEQPTEEYPFVLITGRMLMYFHSDSMTGKSKELAKMREDIHMIINHKDGKKLGLKDGDYITVRSRRGELKTRAKLSDEVPPGVVFMSMHRQVNMLTNRALDPVSKTPETKYCAVRIERT